VELQLVESESDEARRLFPGLPESDLAVLSDEGHVWLGNNAFIMCLWALREYRRWAQRLATPVLRPMARHAWEAVSRNRKNISGLLGLKSEAELKKQLSEVTIPTCPVN